MQIGEKPLSVLEVMHENGDFRGRSLQIFKKQINPKNHHYPGLVRALSKKESEKSTVNPLLKVFVVVYFE